MEKHQSVIEKDRNYSTTHRGRKRYYRNNRQVSKKEIWLILGLSFLLIFFAFNAIFLPFLVGWLIAYFLNPLILHLSTIGISRRWATVIIAIAALIFVIMVLTILVPILTWQLQQFVTKAIPIYIEDFKSLIVSQKMGFITKYFNVGGEQGNANLQTLLSSGGDLTKTIMSSILSSGKSIVGSFSFIIIAPVVAFYLLMDWEHMLSTLDSLIPVKNRSMVHHIVYDIDRSVAGFVRGQSTVCLILGLYYAVALTFCGVNYGVLLGLYIGIAAFIPYIGTFSGFVIAIIVVWAQYYQTDWYHIGAVLFAFLFGHFIESYILQPKLIGNSVGLHPVWLMFALFAFGYLFGFVGMLIAVPCAACIGVLVRYGVAQYMKTSLYSGQ